MITNPRAVGKSMPSLTKKRAVWFEATSQIPFPTKQERLPATPREIFKINLNQFQTTIIIISMLLFYCCCYFPFKNIDWINQEPTADVMICVAQSWPSWAYVWAPWVLVAVGSAPYLLHLDHVFACKLFGFSKGPPQFEEGWVGPSPFFSFPKVLSKGPISRPGYPIGRPSRWS